MRPPPSENTVNKALAAARAARERNLSLGLKEDRKTPFDKLALAPTSLRAAINAKCYECVGEDIKEIKYCSAMRCPLHAVRPYQPK